MIIFQIAKKRKFYAKKHFTLKSICILNVKVHIIYGIVRAKIKQHKVI